MEFGDGGELGWVIYEGADAVWAEGLTEVSEPADLGRGEGDSVEDLGGFSRRSIRRLMLSSYIDMSAARFTLKQVVQKVLCLGYGGYDEVHIFARFPDLQPGDFMGLENWCQLVNRFYKSKRREKSAMYRTEQSILGNSVCHNNRSETFEVLGRLISQSGSADNFLAGV